MDRIWGILVEDTRGICEQVAREIIRVARRQSEDSDGRDIKAEVGWRRRSEPPVYFERVVAAEAECGESVIFGDEEVRRVLAVIGVEIFHAFIELRNESRINDGMQ